MIEKRDSYIGARFTQKEREVIKTLAENRQLSLTDFVREAIFSHINHLKENAGNLEVNFFMNKFETIIHSMSTIESCIRAMKNEFNVLIYSMSTIESCIRAMKKEFNVYDLSRIESNLHRRG